MPFNELSWYQDQQTVYVETAEDLCNVSVASVGQGGGLIPLTTITVAVPPGTPMPLSPSDVLQHAGHVITSAHSHVTLPTVPAPQETAVRWKYEQNKQDSKHINTHQTGSSLVSEFIFFYKPGENLKKYSSDGSYFRAQNEK